MTHFWDKLWLGPHVVVTRVATTPAFVYLHSMQKTSTRRDNWRREWRAQCRRQLDRPTLARIKYGFAWVHKPVLDDGPSRAFTSMAEYRRWCHDNLPEYLGYRIVGAHDAAK